MTMRQYANRSQSGTVSSTVGRKDPIDHVTDRVMMIAKRLVAAEDLIKSQSVTIKAQSDRIEKLEKKIENLVLRSEGKEFKKPEPTTRTRKKPTTTTES